MIAGEKAAIDSKAKIRSCYKGVDPSELEVIMPIALDEVVLETRKLKGRCRFVFPLKMMNRPPHMSYR